MASNTSTYSDQQQQQLPGTQIPVDYVPNEEEKRVFRECSHESFWYRSVPFSVISMAITQALVTRGSVSVSPRFGPLPKLAFAGMFGYFAGKISYMKTCHEKFKSLENSPLGEALRKRAGSAQQYSQGHESEMSHPDKQSFDPMFQATSPSQIPSYSRDFDQGYNPDPSTQMSRDGISGQAKSYLEEEEPQRKSILYENLRVKNRENYEVTLTQKAEATLKPSPEKERDRTKKEVKKNIYGDTWEE
ncbi:OCIA domain-containing protein 1 [Cynoglossus semilaevis]|uniref:OCIA domain-containing protein 1 n=1 Tax=Cynoglossus semilaevis TaxID=244447 RepID=A0A3P8VIP2_CYNSE|nr:OCIA domain-containing protein 1 [Cynoglossus semilaevis]